MVRLFIFLVVVLGLGWGFSWLADRPGLISITWQDHLIETSLMVAATAVVALIGLAMILWWIVGVIWTSPYSVRRYFRARKRDRGYQALSTGLIAAGAGNALLARKMSLRTRGLISADQEPLIHLLEAQAALIEGKHDEARKKFEQMAEDPETRELGLRGLYMEARRLGANEAARQYAEKAVEHAPYLPWAAQATLESRSQSGRWDDAIRLLDQQRMANILEKPQAERWNAVLLTAKANDRLEGDPKGARDDAMAALKLAKDLVPAAIIAAKAWLREDNVRKAASTLESVWKLGPHPEIGRAYIRARSGDSTIDRLKRAEKLEAMRPNNIESLLAVAQAALDAQEFKKPAPRRKPPPAWSLARRSTCCSPISRRPRPAIRAVCATGWRRLCAPRAIRPGWPMVSFPKNGCRFLPSPAGSMPSNGRRRSTRLEGPVEEGSLAGDTAIASLPPVREVKPEPRAEEAPKPILVKPAPQEIKPVPQEVKPPQKELAVAAKTTAPANVTPKGGKTPENGEEPVPFFGRPPDDPGVKDRDAAQPATRLRLF